MIESLKRCDTIPIFKMTIYVVESFITGFVDRMGSNDGKAKVQLLK